MSFEHSLQPEDVIDNRELTAIFRCSPQGGMRRSLETNTLVLVSDHTKSIYEDRWIGDTFHYTGMGLKGDQSINAAQNKTLAESQANGVEVYLFEVLEQGSYVFQGQVELTAKPYQEDQPDIQGSLRKVWIFPLKRTDTSEAKPLPAKVMLKKEEAKEREAASLSDTELEKRARHTKKGVGTRQVTTSTFERNAYVAELAKRRAKGTCQLCDNLAPFKDKKGKPFLETHHIIWLSQDGPDTIENTVALCPNCHRKMHALNRGVDIEKLKAGIAK